MKIPETPMMSKEEIRLFSKELCSRKRVDVLEWGSGGSTIYFTNLLREKGVPFTWTSIEYNKKWYEGVKEKVGPEVEVVLFDVGNDEVKQLENPMDEYVEYPKTTGKKYDVILVDGRKRRRCLLVAKEVLRKGGVVFLHDAQRRYYHSAFSEYPDSRRVLWRMWRGSLDKSGPGAAMVSLAGRFYFYFYRILKRHGLIFEERR